MSCKFFPKKRKSTNKNMSIKRLFFLSQKEKEGGTFTRRIHRGGYVFIEI